MDLDLDLDDIGISGPDSTKQSGQRPSRFKPKLSNLKSKSKVEAVPKPEPEAARKQEDPQPLLDSKAKIEVEEERLEKNAMEEDEHEDRVVREIDVFFNPSPLDNDTKLYVLQYPLRPCWRPYELNEKCEVRIKPESSQVQIDLDLDVDGDNYDSDAAKNLTITKQTLSSSWKPPLATGYAVGVLLGNKLHLNPVQAVVQLRPSMEHLTSGDLKKKTKVTRDVESKVKRVEANGQEAPGPSKRQAKIGRISDEQSSDDAEAWISLKYHDIESSSSKEYRDKMTVEENSPIQFSMSPYNYLNSLCPGTSTDNNRTKGPSRRFLLSLPLEERFKKYLCEGPQVHRFSALKHLAPDYPSEDVLKALQQSAYLVQGLWVTKTKLLREGSDALARDYILLLFSKNPMINCKQLDNTKFSKENLKLQLNPLAVERPSFQDWKFKEPTDLSFIKMHPHIVREEERFWETRGKVIMESIHKSSKSGSVITKFTKPTMTNRPDISSNTDQSVKGNLNVTLRSGTVTMSDETREALPKVLLELFRIHKVCSLQLICQGLRDLAVSRSSLPKADARATVAAARAASPSASLSELQAVITEIAISIHGVYVLKSSEHRELDPLRRVVINLFCAKAPNTALRRAEVVEAAKISLKRDITDVEYTKVLNELCVCKRSQWYLKSGDGIPK